MTRTASSENGFLENSNCINILFGIFLRVVVFTQTKFVRNKFLFSASFVKQEPSWIGRITKNFPLGDNNRMTPSARSEKESLCVYRACDPSFSLCVNGQLKKGGLLTIMSYFIFGEKSCKVVR